MKKYIGNKAFYRTLFSIMLPILLQNVITNFVNLIDNVMVGQVGTEPMSGVAIVNQLIFVFNLAIFGGLAGAGIFTAQFYGKEDNEGIRYTFRIKWYIALVTFAAFTAVLLTMGDRLINLYINEGSEELDMALTLESARSYLKIIMIQLLPFAITQVYVDTLRSTGETVIPMKASIIAVFVNMFFNYILIFGKFGAPALGVTGAAIATVLARFAELAIVVTWTHRHKELNPFIIGAYASPKIPAKLVKTILLTGAPLLINELLWSSGMATLNQCYSCRGLEAISAINIENTAFDLFLCLVHAMGQTISIIIGKLLGAGEIERAVEDDKKLILVTVSLNVVIGALILVTAPLFPQAYNTTAAVRELAARMMRVNGFLMPFYAFTNACYFTLRSGGKTIITFIFDSAFQWVICVPAALALSRLTGLTALQMFTVIQLLEIVKCVIGFIMVRQRKWAVNIVEA